MILCTFLDDKFWGICYINFCKIKVLTSKRHGIIALVLLGPYITIYRCPAKSKQNSFLRFKLKTVLAIPASNILTTQKGFKHQYLQMFGYKLNNMSI